MTTDIYTLIKKYVNKATLYNRLATETNMLYRKKEYLSMSKVLLEVANDLTLIVKKNKNE